MRLVRIVSFAVLGIAFVVSPWTGLANHSWNGYHWARTANPFTVRIGNNMTPNWNGFLGTAAADWSKPNTQDFPDVLDAVVVNGQANPRNCRPTSGRVEVCNGTYGNTGWLGVAQIWVRGSHITQGTVKLNDTYFNTPTYDSSAWRQLVICQEVGHTFGLDHQDENFDNPNLGTCMDYTSNPVSNQHPNYHDYEELAIIYQHLDTTTTVFSSKGASNANVEHSSEWGQLMKTKRGGRHQVFERDLGNSEHIVTFVIWA